MKKIKEIIYNPAFSYHKNPVGAVNIGEKINITIDIINYYRICSLKLVMHKDYESVYQYYNLSIANSNSSYNSYKLEFSIETPGIYWYNFEFIDCYGLHYISYSESLDCFISNDYPRCYQLSICDRSIGDLSWYKGKVIYQIMVDRFYNGGIKFLKEDVIYHDNWNDIPNYLPINGEILNNDFFGGDLLGIIKKLDYLKSLNISVIYLNPIFLSPSNHKYDTSDYMMVDPMFGTIDDFSDLVKEAKKRDISIILDGVFNHTGDDSVYFNKYNNFNEIGAYQSKESKYYSWYKFSEYPNKYACWWNFITLPSVNQTSKSYLEFITGNNGVINYWLNKGVKGFRLDVVDELETNFIEKISNCIKTNDNNNIVIGEVWEDASNKVSYGKRRSYFNSKELDTVMNYPFREAIIDYLVNNNYLGLRNRIRSIINNYPSHSLNSLMNILSTHDTTRLITSFCGVNRHFLSRDEQANFKMTKEQYYIARQKLKMATAIQYTLPGVPTIFYGDEAGIEGFRDPFCRKTFPWDNIDSNIFDWYKFLGELRLDNVYYEGIYQEEFCESGVFAFSRSNVDKKIITIINNSNYDFMYKITNGFDLYEKVNLSNLVKIYPQSVRIIEVKY